MKGYEMDQILKQYVPREFDFVGIGQPKSGTSALWFYILQHPDVYSGPNSLPNHIPYPLRAWCGVSPENVPWVGLEVKEPNFFNLPDQYDPVERFEIKKYRTWLDGVNMASSDKLVGEFTVHYMRDKTALQRIKTHSPNAKIIAILRNPVNRCYSHLNWLNNPKNLGEWEARLEHITSRAVEWNKFSLSSRYANQIKDCFEIFDKEQLMFVKYEEFKEKNQETIEKVLRFLNLDISKYEFTERKVLTRDWGFPIPDKYKRLFYDEFSPEIAEIEDLLGWDCGDWYKY